MILPGDIPYPIVFGALALVFGAHWYFTWRVDAPVRREIAARRASRQAFEVLPPKK